MPRWWEKGKSYLLDCLATQRHSINEERTNRKVTAALAAVNVSDRLLRQVLVENYSSTTLKGWCDPKGGISAGELAVLRKQLAAASLHTINMVW